MVSITSLTSATLLPRERSETGFLKPWRIGPAAMYPPSCSNDLYKILPELRSGTIKTLACPATGEPGAFLWAISGLMAQSSCISPSIIISGWLE